VLPSVLQAAQPRHLVVLDAGSTGTRVHVFQYAADSSSSYASLLLPEPKLKVQPGLSAYADNAPGAAASLHPLLQFASQHIPASQVPQTPVYLMATAGLRLLPTAAADSILKECRSTLLASDFLFEPDWAQVISGTYEGLYAWVAANYAAGHLQVGPNLAQAAAVLTGMHAVAQSAHCGPAGCPRCPVLYSRRLLQLRVMLQSQSTLNAVTARSAMLTQATPDVLAVAGCC
jgi:Golgi nucleoside diphosphatase